MSRIEIIKKNIIKNMAMLSVMIVLILAILIGSSYYFDAFNPKLLTADNVKEYACRTVYIINPGQIIYSQETRLYYNRAFTDNDELILIEAKNNQFVGNLQRATTNNKVEVTGILQKLSADEVAELKSLYADQNITIYDYKLSAANNWIRYFLIGILVFTLMLIGYGMISVQRRYRGALRFFEENHHYDQLPATLTIGNNVEVIDNMLVNMLNGDTVDLKKYDKFKIIEHRQRFMITTHITLNCSTVNGETIKLFLPSLNSRQQNDLLAYLKSIGKSVLE